MRLKISLYEFFVKTASFPIGAELSRKPRFFRQFGGVKRKSETYILIGVRHSDACKVCVAATGRLLGRCGIQWSRNRFLYPTVRNNEYDDWWK